MTFLPTLRRLIAIASVALLASGASAQRKITSPLEEFGHNLGDDYFLANYKQLSGYWHKLERESDRIKVVNIGTTEEGRPMEMAIVTSPANQKRIGKLQEIARKLALAESKSDTAALELVKDTETRETFSPEECETLLRGFLSPQLFEKGLICRADDRGDPVIQISPPLIATQAEFDIIAGTIGEVLSEAWQRM